MSEMLTRRCRSCIETFLLLVTDSLSGLTARKVPAAEHLGCASILSSLTKGIVSISPSAPTPVASGSPSLDNDRGVAGTSLHRTRHRNGPWVSVHPGPVCFFFTGRHIHKFENWFDKRRFPSPKRRRTTNPPPSRSRPRREIRSGSPGRPRLPGAASEYVRRSHSRDVRRQDWWRGHLPEIPEGGTNSCARRGNRIRPNGAMATRRLKLEPPISTGIAGWIHNGQQPLRGCRIPCSPKDWEDNALLVGRSYPRVLPEIVSSGNYCPKGSTERPKPSHHEDEESSKSSEFQTVSREKHRIPQI